MTVQPVIENEMLATLCAFLMSHNLPYKDISIEKNLMVCYVDDNGNVIGSGGLEFYGPYALLRSIAVHQDFRGKAIGKSIVLDLLERAKEKKVSAIYLLTETAHDYFIRLHFHDVDRKNVPHQIRSSTEFTNVCPASADCMVYEFEHSQ